MAIPQAKDFTSGRSTVVELGDRREEASLPIKESSGSKVLESLRPGEHMSRVLQLLATFYAVAMLVITLRVYTGTHQHPGLLVFFVACTASFYIICYNALSIEVGFKRWLEQHYPSLRSLSLAFAAVLTMVPLGVLYLAQAKDATNPTPPPVAKLPAQTAAPDVATKVAAGESRKADPNVTQAKTTVNPNPSLVAKLPVETAAAAVPTKVPTGDVRKPDPAVGVSSDRTAILTNVRYSSGTTSTTVTIDLDEAVQYDVNRLTEPDRIYLDLRGSKLDPGFMGTRPQVTDSLLRAIRVAEHDGNSTRVTLVTNHFCDYSVTPAADSHRLLIELRNPAGKN